MNGIIATIVNTNVAVGGTFGKNWWWVSCTRPPVFDTVFLLVLKTNVPILSTTLYMAQKFGAQYAWHRPRLNGNNLDSTWELGKNLSIMNNYYTVRAFTDFERLRITCKWKMFAALPVECVLGMDKMSHKLRLMLQRLTWSICETSYNRMYFGNSRFLANTRCRRDLYTRICVSYTAAPWKRMPTSRTSLRPYTKCWATICRTICHCIGNGCGR